MNVVKFPSQHDLEERQLTADEEWEQIEKLKSDVERLLWEVKDCGRNEQRAHNFLRYHFNVSSYTEMTIGQMKKAIPLLRMTIAQCREFSSKIREIQKQFDEEVVGRGAPWTPWIARKAGKRRMHAAGSMPNWEELLHELRGDIGER